MTPTTNSHAPTIEQINPGEDLGQVEGNALGDDIAVIGVSCRFPGAPNHPIFWANLMAGVDSITEVPATRWDWRAFEGEARSPQNKTVSRWGGFVPDADRFDAHFFGISPREAVCMDPQQRMALELAWHCIEDAGYAPEEMSGARVGVYLGASNFDYKTLQERYCQTIQGHMATGNVMAIIANRVSYLLNFRGPSVMNDAACASSLVAIQQAVSALKAGECDTALAGAVALLATPDRYVAFSQIGMLSPTGRCKAFDASADGYVRAEGAGMVYLKPLRHALRDGDPVWGVIKAVATNHCGRTRSLTAPSAQAQAEVITAALQQAGVSPADVSFVETHGTGTPVGDPIEVQGLTLAFDPQGELGRLGPHCALGAVKTNIGHLEAGAGIAGVIKVLLALRHRQLPANLHYAQLNPRITLEGTPFRVQDKAGPWLPATDAQGRPKPLLAGVNSFGFGGVNGHLLIAQAPDRSPDAASAQVPDAAPTSRPGLLALSARSASALSELARQYADTIERSPQLTEALCRQTNLTRARMPHRLAVAFEGPQDLVKALRDRAARMDGGQAGVPAGSTTVGFLFTGQGAQYIGMGMGLYESQPAFKAAFDACDTLFEPHLGGSLADLLQRGEAATLNETRYTQPALFSVAYALARLWAAHGVVPAVSLGHSIGEIAAACVAEALSLPDAVALVARRATLMQDLCLPGAMATVFAPPHEVQSVLDRHDWVVDIAAVNAPESTVLSGDAQDLAEALRVFEAAGTDVKPLAVTRAFHSRLIAPMQSPFLASLQGMAFRLPQHRVMSNVTGTEMQAADWSPSYWVDHARRPVMFLEGVKAMKAAGVDLMIEIGPSPTLLKLARRNLGDDTCLVASLDPSSADSDAFMRALVAVHEAGVDLRFEAMHEGRLARRVPLPPYPFKGDSYWVHAGEPTVLGAPPGAAPTDTLVGRRLSLAGQAAPCFELSLDTRQAAHAYLCGHLVQGRAVLPGAAYAGMGIAAAQQAGALQGPGTPTVSDLEFLRPLVLTQPVSVQTWLKPGQGTSSVFEVWARPAAVTQGHPDKPDGAAQPDWQLHARGTVGLCEAPSGTPGTQPKRAAASSPVDIATFYDGWKAVGVDYQGAFRALTALELREHECRAQVVLPPEAGRSAPSGWHPAMLDGLWQSVLPLLPESVRAQGLLPLPAGVARVAFQGPLPHRANVLARCLPPQDDDGTHRFDLVVSTDTGEVVGSVEGLRVKPSQALVLPDAADARPQDELHCLVPRWYRPASAGAPTEPGTGPSLIVCTPDSLALARRLRAALGQAPVTMVGLDLAAPEADLLALDAGDAASLRQALLACKQLDTVYFLGGFHHTRAMPSPPVFEQWQDRGPRALLTVLKTLDEQGAWRAGGRLKVVGNHSQPVHGAETIIPWGAACYGLARVHAKESPGLRLVNLDLALPEGASDAVLAGAADQILAADSLDGADLAYRGDQLYRRRLEALAWPAGPADRPVYRHQGVYILVGGAGGIGLALSRQLAAQHQARLVWVGRSAVDEARQAAMAEVQAAGGQVVYRQADVCDLPALKAIIAETLCMHGRIDGVFHAALSLQDQSLARMSLAQFNATYDAKARGTLVLAQAIEGLPLDFVAFFSSANSFVCNRGQGNYVAACVFQDAFGHYARQALHLPVHVINWGRWGEVGAVASEAHQARLDAQGFLALSPSDGLATCEAVLATPAAQVLVLRADARLLAAMQVDDSSRLSWVATPSAAASSMACDDGLTQTTDLPDPAVLREGLGALNRLAMALFAHAVDQLSRGTLPPHDSVDALREGLGIAPQHAACFAAMLGFLGSDTRPAPLSLAQLSAEKDRLLARAPWLAHELRLLWACGEPLPAILRGEVPATSVVFPDMSMALVEGVYRAGALAQACNQGVARQVAAALMAWHRHAPGQPVRVVEVGAGTGGTTAAVLHAIDALPDACKTRLSYVYTDISPAFLNHGRAAFASGRPYMQFELLDVDQPMSAQPHQAGSVDLIVAANVLHATADLGRTLQNLKYLLKRDGLLVLNELMRAQPFLTLTFGLLDGWWLSQDGAKRLPHSPLLSEDLWRLALADEGFETLGCQVVGAGQDWSQGVLLARGDGAYRTRVHGSPGGMAAGRRGPGDAQTAEGQARAEAVAGVGADALTAAIGSVSVEELKATAGRYMRTQLAEVLQVQASQLDQGGRPMQELFLSELGIDSLTAMDLRGRLRAQLGINVPVEVLLGGTRVAGVVDLLCEQLMVQRLMARQDTTSSPTALGDTEDMESFTL